jgi:endonuclease G
MRLRKFQRYFRRFIYLSGLCALIYYFASNGTQTRETISDILEGDFTPLYEGISDAREKASQAFHSFDPGQVGEFFSGDPDYDPIFGEPLLERSGYKLQVLDNGPWDVGYSNQYGIPVWVSYRAMATNKHKSDDRPESFTTDHRVRNAVGSSTYVHSGYDRGHLFPNYLASVCYGREAQEASFLMTNIVPQNPDLNRGSWRLLEERVGFDYRHDYGEVHVLTGPYFNSSGNHRFIGGKVLIPDGYWKVILVENRKGKMDTLAFMLPQDASPYTPVGHYLVSIDEIEAVTGLNLFPELTDKMESTLESKKASGVWK